MAYGFHEAHRAAEQHSLPRPMMQKCQCEQGQKLENPVLPR